MYRGPSYRRHAWGEPNPWFRDHDSYVRLEASEHDRQCAYRELFRDQIAESDTHDIRECLAYNHPLGNDRFREPEPIENAYPSHVARDGDCGRISTFTSDARQPFAPKSL
ncbi:MAG: hypothetical protein ACREVY_12590 [Gammaproteobacteria bacterium]